MLPFSPVLLEETTLGVLFGVVFILFIVMSFIFSYHWKRFGIPTPLFRKMRHLYFIVSGGLATLSILLFAGIMGVL